MPPLHVGLLEFDHVDATHRGAVGDYAGMFRTLLEPHGIEVVPYDVVNGVLPSKPGECDAWVATGSRRSVYDDDAWITDAIGLIREIDTAGRPFIGICFGHQLVAHALGGVVERASTGWGVGPHVTEFVEVQSWMQPVLDAPRLLYMHQDQVHALPKGGRVLASTAHCPVAALQVRALVGIQAHPEFPPAYVERLLDERIERIGAERVDAARTALDASRASGLDSATVGAWMAGYLGA